MSCINVTFDMVYCSERSLDNMETENLYVTDCKSTSALVRLELITLATTSSDKHHMEATPPKCIVE